MPLGSPLLTTDVNITTRAPIVVKRRHGALRRNIDRGTEVWFTDDRFFHICHKQNERFHLKFMLSLLIFLSTS